MRQCRRELCFRRMALMRSCPRCSAVHQRRGSYCVPCHNAYMRTWRKAHPMSPEERRRDICRSYTHVLIKRGHITRGPCQVCAAEPAQAHHPDYSDPRRVEWLCPEHHDAHHTDIFG